MKWPQNDLILSFLSFIWHFGLLNLTFKDNQPVQLNLLVCRVFETQTTRSPLLCMFSMPAAKLLRICVIYIYILYQSQKWQWRSGSRLDKQDRVRTNSGDWENAICSIRSVKHTAIVNSWPYGRHYKQQLTMLWKCPKLQMLVLNTNFWTQISYL